MSTNQTWVFYDSIAKVQTEPLSREEAQSTILKIRAQNVDRLFIWTPGWQNWQPLKSYLESDQKNFVSTFTISHTPEETINTIAKEVFEQTSTHAHTQTSFPHESDTSTHTKNKTYSSIMLKEETVSRFMRSGDSGNDYTTHFSIDQVNIEANKPTLDFSKLKKRAMGKRADRIELKIEILLVANNGKSFRTQSKNISLTGVLLEDCIPFDFYNTTFEIVVINHFCKNQKQSRVRLKARTVEAGGNFTQRLHYANPTPNQKNDLKNLLEDYLSNTKKIKNNSAA